MSQLLDGLRKGIRASGKTGYRIAKDTGVARSQLSRLMTGERGLSIETVEKLVNYLELEMVIRPKRRQKDR